MTKEEQIPPFRKMRKTVAQRREAKQWRRRVVESKGASCLTSALRREIRRYARSVFGSTIYTPWLEYYTEVRGEFVRGWVPKDYYQRHLLPVWNPRDRARLSQLKTLSQRLLPNAMFPALALLIRGTWQDPADGTTLTDRQVLERIAPHAELVLKRDGSSGGRAVEFIEQESFIERFRAASRDGFGSTSAVLQPVFHQHAEFSRLHPRSVNTLRILTYITDRGTPEAIYVCCRAGHGGARVDNASSGGFFVPLSMDGRPAKGSAFDKYGLPIERHPTEGYAFSDLCLPDSIVESAVALCVDSHVRVAWVRLVAWDVGIAPGGEPWLLEWNAIHPGWEKHEAVAGPLLGRYVLDGSLLVTGERTSHRMQP